jgi:hypothetical protein
MSFINRLKDDVNLVKSDGQEITGIKAMVQSNLIIVGDGSLPIEEGDTITRQLPNGLMEYYLVIDRGFFPKRGTNPDHYQVKVKKQAANTLKRIQFTSPRGDTPKTSPNIATDFSFVTDPRITAILDRDYKELQKLDPEVATKTVLVLSGGIIEGLLFDALVASGKWTFDQACQNFLKDMIGPALNKGIITEDKLTDAIRRYRNLIHPGREVKESMKFDKSDAQLARHAVDVSLREVREWDSKRNASA